MAVVLAGKSYSLKPAFEVSSADDKRLRIHRSTRDSFPRSLDRKKVTELSNDLQIADA